MRLAEAGRWAAAVCGVAMASWISAMAATEEGPGLRRAETIDEALCRTIESSARAHRLPVAFFTRLIWRESSFRTGVVSPAGAEGVAQFMPRTASERGLADPFDPEQAIPQAAHLLADLVQQFGSLGLAAAAYNGGAARVRNWLDGHGGLPAETQDYVLLITRRSVEDWVADPTDTATEDAPSSTPQSCLQLTVALRRSGRQQLIAEAPFAPWGVQLAGNFSKARALSSFARARQSYAAILGDIRPMIIGTRLRSRGTRPFYRVRVPAATRAAAIQLCTRIHATGGSCIVLPS